MTNNMNDKGNTLKCVLIFVLGLAVGLATGAWGFRYHAGKHFSMRPKTEHIMDRLTRELDLTMEQKEQVAALLEANKARMDAIRDESRPRIDALRQKGVEDIRGILTAEQSAKFDALKRKWEERRERHHSKDGTPPPPPPRH